MAIKYLTSEEVSKKFYSLTKNIQIEVLYEAIEYMQKYNGRSRLECIALGMGYEKTEGSDNKYFKKA